MRVLQLIDSLDSGGAERMAVNYVNMLSLDHESFICATRAEGLLKQSIAKGVNYFFLNKKNALDIKAIKRLNSFVKSNDIEIIHAHSTSFFIATIIKLFNKKIKLIWHDHYGNSEFLMHRKFKILRLCSYQFNSIISVNKLLKEWSEINLKCKDVIVLNNFVMSKIYEIKETVLKGINGKRIVCLANLRQQKNHIMLLEAFKEVFEFDNECTLHLVGKNKGDDYSKRLKEKIDTLQLQSNVFIYGSRSDIHNILNQSDIAVLPSISEGLPLALLEYGLAKLPVVATNVGDCNEVITQSSEGFLIESENTKEFSKAIIQYISNPNLRIQCGKTLHANVVTNFGEKKIKNQLIKIYTS